MSTQQHDSALHPREQSGKFAAKPVSDPAGGLDSLKPHADGPYRVHCADCGVYKFNATFPMNGYVCGCQIEDDELDVFVYPRCRICGESMDHRGDARGRCDECSDAPEDAPRPRR